MIDADKIEQDLDAAPGTVVAFDKDDMRAMVAELRRGQQAMRALANAVGHATTAIAVAGVRVSGGYSVPDQAIAA